MLTKFNNYYLTSEEDSAFMANIDIEALERGLEQAEREIANGKEMKFEEAMKKYTWRYLVKIYNVIFLSSFSKMFETILNNYKNFSLKYAMKIEQSLYRTLEFLKMFPYATSTIKFRGNSHVYRKFVIQKRFLY